MQENVMIDLVKGVEGLALYINDYRVAGPKPWGGGKMIRQWTVPLSGLRRALKIEEADKQCRTVKKCQSVKRSK